jgi:hypothetical protein
MKFTTVKIEKPDDVNFILGQSHFIKTVEDIHEALVQTVPGIKFGLAFCEASGAKMTRVLLGVNSYCARSDTSFDRPVDAAWFKVIKKRLMREFCSF